MSSCWKCGKPTPEGVVECEYGCGAGEGRLEFSGSDAEMKAAWEKFVADSVEVDMNKVIASDYSCAEFLCAVMRVPMPDKHHLSVVVRGYLIYMFRKMRVLKNSPQYERLKHFLKEPA